MKIFGVGTDIIRVSRIKNMLRKKKLIIRLFNQQEILNCKKKVNSR